jgi:hypothetical protein
MRSIIITAVTLFALSGAILGFAVGAFTHSRQPQQAPTTQQKSAPKSSPTASQAQVTPTTTTTPVATAQALCGPLMGYTTTGTGATAVYTITTQAKGKTPAGSCPGLAAEPNITASGITSRIWLTKGKSANVTINPNALGDPAALNSTTNFPNEVVGGLQFVTPQVQTTNSNGVTTWQVTLSPTLTKGTYWVVGLNDWNGTYYNWSWFSITLN